MYIEDLLGVWNFHAPWSLDAADRMVGEIEAKVDLIGDFPVMGERYPPFGERCRRTLADRYVIYYDLREDYVEVLRVFHGAQQIDRLS